MNEQRWWTLAIDGRPSAWRTTAEAALGHEEVWGGALPADGTPRHQRTRQWAELSIWYPALSPAAGAVPLTNLAQMPLGSVDLGGFPAQGRNLDFTSIGGDTGISGGSNVSHSYLQVKRFQDVWKGYRVIRSLVAQ